MVTSSLISLEGLRGTTLALDLWGSDKALAAVRASTQCSDKIRSSTLSQLLFEMGSPYLRYSPKGTLSMHRYNGVSLFDWLR